MHLISQEEKATVMQEQGRAAAAGGGGNVCYRPGNKFLGQKGEK